MNEIKQKVAKWFWVIAVFALIWNLLGVLAYLAQVFATPEMLDSWPDDQRAMVENRPIWATGAFAIAVWSGLFGSILLLMKNRYAIILFTLSLIGIIIQFSYELVLVETRMEYGFGEIVTTALIPIIAIIMVIVSRIARKRGWIR